MKGSRLSLDVFKIFVDLVQTQSFSRAAERNLLTQSAVSQQISCIERLMGRRLLDRGKGRLVLTEAGRAFLAGSQKLVADYHDLLESVQHPGKTVAGTLTVETVYSVGLHSLTPYVRSFLQRYPQVDLILKYERSNRIYQDVSSGECDLGIVAYPESRPSLKTSIVNQEDLVLVCPPGDPLAKRRSVRLTDLAGRPFVAFTRDVPTRRAIDQLLRRAGVSVRLIHEVDNIETLKRLIEVGSGLSILPDKTVRQEVRDRTLAAVPLSPGRRFLRPIGVLQLQRRTPSRAMQEFVRWLHHAPVPQPPSAAR